MQSSGIKFQNELHKHMFINLEIFANRSPIPVLMHYSFTNTSSNYYRKVVSQTLPPGSQHKEFGENACSKTHRKPTRVVYIMTGELVGERREGC